MSQYQLVALDLDGTLFDNNSRIPKANLAAIRRLTKAGIHAVLSTGRPFAGLPFDQIADTGIDYAITANGGGIYRLSTGECLAQDAMDESLILPILDFLLARDLHIVAFIDGRGYTPAQCASAGEKLALPAELKEYVVQTRIMLDDLPAFIRERHAELQKVTLNFYPDADGTFVDRETVRIYLEQIPGITCVCGGYNNLEFTRAGVNKGRALRTLAALLGVDLANTMAIGDTENDIAILQAAGCAVAMENATEAVRRTADYVTAANTDNGVAAALRHFFPELFQYAEK